MVGAEPTVAQPISIAPIAATLVLTGFAPTVSVSQAVQPLTGGLTITGPPPVISRGGVDAANISTSGARTDAVNPQTWSHTCAANVNKLVVTIHGGSATIPHASAVTYNSVAMTRAIVVDDGAFEGVEIWYLDNPTTGSAQTISVNLAGNNQFFGTAIGLVNSASGAPRATNSTTGSAANPSVSVTTLAGDIVIGAYASDLGPLGSTTAGGTQIAEAEDVNADSDFSAEYYTASGSSQAVAWVAPAVGATPPSDGLWAIAGASFPPATATSATITPSTGSLVLTGVAPVVTQIMTRAPATGSLVLTGGTPTVAQGTIAAPVAGSLVLTGVAPGVTQAANRTPTAGTLVLTGAAPSATQQLNITPQTGSLTLTGAAPLTVRQDTIRPDTGALVLTGGFANTGGANAVVPNTGSLVLTGVAPVVTRQNTVQPNAGSLILSGVAPIVTRQDTVQPVAGSLTLAGAAPIVLPSISIRPNTVALVLTGAAPTVVVASPAILRTPGTGSLVIAGVAGTSLIYAEPRDTARFVLQGRTVVLRVDIEPVAIVDDKRKGWLLPARTTRMTL